MEIKLKFNNPVAISPFAERDKMVLHIKQVEYFYSPEVTRDLHRYWYTLRTKIKKQVPDDDTTNSLKESAATS